MAKDLLNRLQEADTPFKAASPEEVASRVKDMPRPKCPKCGKKCETMYVEQKFCTKITGEFDGMNYAYDLEAGYTQLDEWLSSMLNEEGTPEVLGCDKCYG